MWVVASSSVILFAPVIFEVERAQMAEMEKSQQKQVYITSLSLIKNYFWLLLMKFINYCVLFQVLLGTNTALAGPMPPNMPPMPR